MKIDNTDTSKISRTSLIYNLMRLVHRRNNPNKETLIYIPLPHVAVIRVYITRIAKQHNKLLIGILLLLYLI